jgi:hypothetical protein
LGLPGETEEEAREWVKALGLPWYGHCDVCYRWNTNDGTSYRFCAEHTIEEIDAAKARESDLRRYLRERYVRSLDASRKTR